MAKKRKPELRDAGRRARGRSSSSQQMELGEPQTMGVYATPASAEAHQAFIDRIKRTAPTLPEIVDDYDWLS
jgi:hypothetical protein